MKKKSLKAAKFFEQAAESWDNALDSKSLKELAAKLRKKQDRDYYRGKKR